MIIETLIVGYGIYKLFSKKEEKKEATPTPTENIVCLVGRTSSGKSSTANALMGYEAFDTGIEHGTTTVPFPYTVTN
jgi:GTP-binding protein EngB required for normal cell division